MELAGARISPSPPRLYRRSGGSGWEGLLGGWGSGRRTLLLLHVFLPALLVLSKFLLLAIVQDRLDLGAGVIVNALHFGHLVVPGQATVLTQRHHLLLRVGKNRLDLRLLIG